MRALVLVALLLAACASPQRLPASQAYADVTTLEGFYIRETEYASRDSGSGFASAPPALKSCVIRGIMPLMPETVHAAANRFLADKTEANWQEYDRISRASANDIDFDGKAKAVTDSCKSKFTS